MVLDLFFKKQKTNYVDDIIPKLQSKRKSFIAQLLFAAGGNESIIGGFDKKQVY